MDLTQGTLIADTATLEEEKKIPSSDNFALSKFAPKEQVFIASGIHAGKNAIAIYSNYQTVAIKFTSEKIQILLYHPKTSPRQ